MGISCKKNQTLTLELAFSSFGRNWTLSNGYFPQIQLQSSWKYLVSYFFQSEVIMTSSYWNLLKRITVYYISYSMSAFITCGLTHEQKHIYWFIYSTLMHSVAIPFHWQQSQHILFWLRKHLPPKGKSHSHATIHFPLSHVLDKTSLASSLA